MLNFFVRCRPGFQSNRATFAKCNSLQLTRNLQGLVIGVPKESIDGEHRVALTPNNVTKLVKSGASVKLESNAGLMSGFTDDLYKSSGGEIVPAADVWKSDVVTKVFNIFHYCVYFNSHFSTI